MLYKNILFKIMDGVDDNILDNLNQIIPRMVRQYIVERKMGNDPFRYYIHIKEKECLQEITRIRNDAKNKYNTVRNETLCNITQYSKSPFQNYTVNPFQNYTVNPFQNYNNQYSNKQYPGRCTSSNINYLSSSNRMNYGINNNCSSWFG